MEKKADDFDFSNIDNIEVEDGENFYGKKGLSKEQIILKALQKCMDEGSKEMTEGGIIKRMINNQVYELAVPNQKEIFINSIRILWTLIFPLILEKYKELCNEQLGDFVGNYNNLVEEYDAAKIDLKQKHNYKGNPSALKTDINELKSMFEEKKMDLYRQKLEFGILVLEKENWFGERFA